MREIEHTFIPLKDGTRLAARIWLPDDAERHPVPAILEYLPYRKRDGTRARDALTHPWLADHGYAGVRVDIRGSGESDGLLDDEYARQEQLDALEVIAWLAAQPWCSGAVGMMGISWGGFNGLQVASLRPPALKAIITLCSTDDRYRDDVHYMGGARLNAGFGWAGFFFSEMALPPDPELVGARWRDMWLARLNHLPLFQERWLRHQHRDDYWRHGSVCEDYGAIQCPVYAIGGWTDGYTNAIPRLLQHLQVPRKGLIGPWAHAYPHFARPGPRIGFLQESLRWWDHWLKGKSTGVMDEPMLRAWLIDSVKPAPWHGVPLPGRWVSEPSWPPPGTTAHRLHLSDDGLGAHDSPLTARTVCTPMTLGKHSGEWCAFNDGEDQPGDQREDDALSLVFDSAPLAETIELLGAPSITLDIASDKPIANLIVRLCDLRPNGESLHLSFGVLNLAHRDSHATPSPLVPGQRYRTRIPLNDAGVSVPAGHRLRLAISTTCWPMVWPAPEAATVTIFAGSLELPHRPARTESLPPLPPPQTAAPEPVTRIGPGVERLDRIGLELGSTYDFRFDIEDGDPLSAVAEMRRTSTMARGDWRVRIDTMMRMTCTRDAFHLAASLSARDGEHEVCQRQWDITIPRDLV